MQHQTSVQVWLRIYGLSQEYWRKNILFAIASSVGTPICTDSISSKPFMERSFGHFARVLVDVDLSEQLRYGVLVERKGYAFFVDFEYENLPDFCVYCKSIGHHVDNCRRKRGVNIEKDVVQQPKKNDATLKQVYVAKEKVPVPIASPSKIVVSPRNHEDVQLENEVNAELEHIHDINQVYSSRTNISVARHEDSYSSDDATYFVDATPAAFKKQADGYEDDMHVRSNVIPAAFQKQVDGHEDDVPVKSNVTHDVILKDVSFFEGILGQSSRSGS